MCWGWDRAEGEPLCHPERNDVKALPRILVAVAMLAEGRGVGWRVAGDGSCHNQRGSSSEGSLSGQTGRASQPLLQKQQGLKSGGRFVINPSNHSGWVVWLENSQGRFMFWGRENVLLAHGSR